MNNKTKYIFFVCLLFISIKSIAQNSTQVWVDYYQYRQLNNNKWKMSNRFGARFYPNEEYDARISFRPDIARKVGQHGRFIVGSGFFYVFGIEDNKSLEIRPWAGYKIAPRKLNRLSFTHYFRLENRFFTSSIADYESRFRYKITAETDIFRKEGKALSVILEPEVFVSFGTFDDFNFNRLRVTTGARYKWNSDWQTDLYLTRQDKRTNAVVQGGHDWIIQLKIKRLLIKK